MAEAKPKKRSAKNTVRFRNVMQRRPVLVHLPGGACLRLGPGETGEIPEQHVRSREFLRFCHDGLLKLEIPERKRARAKPTDKTAAKPSDEGDAAKSKKTRRRARRAPEGETAEDMPSPDAPGKNDEIKGAGEPLPEPSAEDQEPEKSAEAEPRPQADEDKAVKSRAPKPAPEDSEGEGPIGVKAGEEPEDAPVSPRKKRRAAPEESEDTPVSPRKKRRAALKRTRKER